MGTQEVDDFLTDGKKQKMDVGIGKSLGGEVGLEWLVLHDDAHDAPQVLELRY